MNLMLLGLLVSFAGVILMILGKLWAVLFFLGGFVLIVAHWAKLYKGAGYEADVNAGNGLYGQGRQQSEANKDPSIPRQYQDRPGNTHLE